MAVKRGTKISDSNQSVLISVARTIGSALGTVAAEAGKLSKEVPVRSRPRKTKSKAGRTRKKRNA